MRVALVQCPPWGSLPPLGSASLKAYIEQHGHEAPCFDLNIDYCRERLEEVLDDVGGSVYARPDPWARSEASSPTTAPGLMCRMPLASTSEGATGGAW